MKIAESKGQGNRITRQLGIEVPVFCGAMYPCSNPELIAAVSEAGGMGIVQPISLVYVYGHDFAQGLDWIRSRTQRPIGLNLLIEKSADRYRDRMEKWLEISLSKGVRFFVTALGNPRWVVERVHAAGGIVYHDVTERKWAEKALTAGVDGLICVNNRAGGHLGQKAPAELWRELQDLNVPLVCAGGIGSEQGFRQALEIGYEGVQMGTRFIATEECGAHADYKNAIVSAGVEQIDWTDKISGVPVSIIKTPSVVRAGLRSGPLASWLLKHRKAKHWMRMAYFIQSLWKLKKASLQGANYKDYWQAGKSVDEIEKIESVEAILARFRREWSVWQSHRQKQE